MAKKAKPRPARPAATVRQRGHVPVRVPHVAVAVAEPVAPVETVASLLAASQAAHARYRQLDTQTPGPASPAMRHWLREAFLLRIQAQANDLRRTDAAWAEDQVLMKTRSEFLIEFYEDTLAGAA